MNNELRVLQVCALNPGGIETFVMNVYREVRKRDIVCYFINYFDKDIEQFHEKEVIGYGSRIYKTGSMNYKNPISKQIHKSISLYKFLKNNKYDIVHIHASDSVSLEDAFICKLAGIKKIIVHSHNTSINNQEKFYKLKKTLHNTIKSFWGVVATDYFACSELAAEWMFSKKLNDSNKIKIINNGINVEDYKYNSEVRTEVRKELGVEENFVVGHIGRFSYQKNHDFLIDIFAEIVKKKSNAILLLIGKGELEDEIKEKVKRLNLEDNVIFYGLSNECKRLMQAMDVFLLPSHFEGLPLVGIEAQAAGLKVGVSDTVSKQMKITENVKYIGLDKSPEYWANEIDYNYLRKDMTKEIADAGYDITKVSGDLVQKYKK